MGFCTLLARQGHIVLCWTHFNNHNIPSKAMVFVAKFAALRHLEAQLLLQAKREKTQNAAWFELSSLDPPTNAAIHSGVNLIAKPVGLKI